MFFNSAKRWFFLYFTITIKGEGTCPAPTVCPCTSTLDIIFYLSGHSLRILLTFLPLLLLRNLSSAIFFAAFIFALRRKFLIFCTTADWASFCSGSLIFPNQPSFLLLLTVQPRHLHQSCFRQASEREETLVGFVLLSVLPSLLET